MTKEEYRLYTDFYAAITSRMDNLKVPVNENLVRFIMTRVDQHTVTLYEEKGIMNAEFGEKLDKIVREALIQKGYLR